MLGEFLAMFRVTKDFMVVIDKGIEPVMEQLCIVIDCSFVNAEIVDGIEPLT